MSSSGQPSAPKLAFDDDDGVMSNYYYDTVLYTASVLTGLWVLFRSEKEGVEVDYSQ